MSRNELEIKETKLREYLSGFENLAVAFSAGGDSSFLLREAQEVLGDRLLALTVSMHSVPKREQKESISFCKTYGIRQRIIEMDEFEIPEFSQNPQNRCYFCKKAILSKMLFIAKEEGFLHLAEGSNLDDDSDYRPGHKAIEELQVLSPLRQAKLTKNEIRQLSKKMGLPTWDKASFACLATRVSANEIITEEKLSRIEQAEQVLFDEGFHQFRVRLHGNDIARIEVLPEEIERLASPDLREKITESLKAMGFLYVTCDLSGYHNFLDKY